MRKKFNYEKSKREGTLPHIHCLICSTPLLITEDGYMPNKYICEECLLTFPDSYILYRIECDRNNLWYPAFDRLESRLTHGHYNKDGSIRDHTPCLEQHPSYSEGEYEV